VHEEVVAATSEVLWESGFASAVETRRGACGRFFSEVPRGAGAEACIPDITYFRRGSHSDHALDVTVRQPREGPPGAAARAGEQEKNKKYAPWMQARGRGSFTPLAVETFGCLGPAFDSLLRECASAAVARDGGGDGPVPEPLVQVYRQRVGVALQRSLAHAFRAAVASGARPDPALVHDEDVARTSHVAARFLEGPPTAGDLARVEVDRDY
jgi:hypothetical protein